MAPPKKLLIRQPIGSNSATSRSSITESRSGDSTHEAQSSSRETSSRQTSSLSSSHLSFMKQQSGYSSLHLVEDKKAKRAAEALGRDLMAMGYDLDNCRSFLTRGSDYEIQKDRYGPPIGRHHYDDVSSLGDEDGSSDDDENEDSDDSVSDDDDEEEEDDDDDDDDDDEESEEEEEDDDDDDSGESEIESTQQRPKALGNDAAFEEFEKPTSYLAKQKHTKNNATEFYGQQSKQSSYRNKNLLPDNPDEARQIGLVTSASNAEEEEEYRKIDKRNLQVVGVETELEVGEEGEEGLHETEGMDQQAGVSQQDQQSRMSSFTDEKRSEKGSQHNSASLRLHTTPHRMPIRSISSSQQTHQTFDTLQTPIHEVNKTKRSVGVAREQERYTENVVVPSRDLHETETNRGGENPAATSPPDDQESEFTGPSEVINQAKNRQQKINSNPFDFAAGSSESMRSIQLLGESTVSPTSEEEEVEQIVIDGISVLDESLPHLQPTNGTVNNDNDQKLNGNAEPNKESVQAEGKPKRGFWNRNPKKAKIQTSSTEMKSIIKTEHPSRKEPALANKGKGNGSKKTEKKKKKKAKANRKAMKETTTTGTETKSSSKTERFYEETSDTIHKSKKKAINTNKTKASNRTKRSASPIGKKRGLIFSGRFQKRGEERGAKTEHEVTVPEPASPLHVVTTENDEGFDVELMSTAVPVSAPRRSPRNWFRPQKQETTTIERSGDLTRSLESEPETGLSDLLILTLEDTTTTIVPDDSLLVTESVVLNEAPVLKKSKVVSFETTAQENTTTTNAKSNLFKPKTAVSPMKRQGSTALATSVADLFALLVGDTTASEVPPTEPTPPTETQNHQSTTTTTMNSNKEEDTFPLCQSPIPCAPSALENLVEEGNLAEVHDTFEEEEISPNTTGISNGGNARIGKKKKTLQSKSLKSSTGTNNQTSAGRGAKERFLFAKTVQRSSGKAERQSFSLPPRPSTGEPQKRLRQKKTPAKDSAYKTPPFQAQGKAFQRGHDSAEMKKFGEDRLGTNEKKDGTTKRVGGDHPGSVERETSSCNSKKMKTRKAQTKQTRKSKVDTLNDKKTKNLGKALLGGGRNQSKPQLKSPSNQEVKKSTDATSRTMARKPQSRLAHRGTMDLIIDDPVVALDGAKRTKSRSPTRTSTKRSNKDPIVTIDRNTPLENERWKPGSPPKSSKNQPKSNLSASQKDEVKSDWNELSNAAHVLDHVMSTVGDQSNGTMDDVQQLLTDDSQLGDVERALATLKKHAKKLGIRETDLLVAAAKSNDSILSSSPTPGEDFVEALSSYISFRQ